MREILFRGKSKSTGKWAYEKIVDDDDLIGELCFFTGISDKNGQRIFEGDIVLVNDKLPSVPKEERYFKGVVEFKDGSFVIRGEEFTHYRWIDYEVVVIGNIYDNPELLEVKP